MVSSPRSDRWSRGWLWYSAATCAIVVPALLIWTFSIEVPGDRCQGAPHRPGLETRHLLWSFAVIAALTGVALSITGLALRRWWYLPVLLGFLVEVALVGISGLGLDPCGLS